MSNSPVRVAPSGPLAGGFKTITPFNFTAPADAVVPANSVLQRTVVFTGAAPGDVVVMSMEGFLAVDLELVAQGVGPNVVYYSVVNPTAGPLAFPETEVHGFLMKK